MKKFILFTFVTFFIAGITHAQIKKGSILLGGGLGFNYSESGHGVSETEYKYLSVNPSVGKAIKENTVLGIDLFYSHSRQVVSGNPFTTKSNGYGIGFFMRRYFTLGKGFYLFGEGNAGYNYSIKKEPYAQDSEYNTMNYSGGIFILPGVSYAIKHYFQLEVSLGQIAGLNYTRNEIESKSPLVTTKTKSSGFGFSSSLSNATPIYVGFRFLLGNK